MTSAHNHPRVLLIAAAILAGVLVQPANAAPLTLVYSITFNGLPPTSTPPWLTATFTQNGAGVVDLELDSSLNVATEFITEIGFNLDPTMLPSSLGITWLSGDVASSVLHTTQNAQDLLGSGNQKFDIMFDFPVAPPPVRFNGNDVSKYEFAGAGLTPESFDFLNLGGYRTGAHVQGIPIPDGTSSGAVTVGEAPIPEPSSALLLGFGLIGFGGVIWGRGRRR